MRREEEKNFLGVVSYLLRHEGTRNHGLLRNEWQTLFDWFLVLGGRGVTGRHGRKNKERIVVKLHQTWRDLMPGQGFSGESAEGEVCCI